MKTKFDYISIPTGLHSDIDKVNQEFVSALSVAQIASKNAELFFESTDQGWNLGKTLFLDKGRLALIERVGKFKNAVNAALIADIVKGVGKAIYFNNKNQLENMAGNLQSALNSISYKLKDVGFDSNSAKYTYSVKTLQNLEQVN